METKEEEEKVTPFTSKCKACKSNPFKDSQGRWITQGLFVELKLKGAHSPIFTLKDHDHTIDGVTYRSLKEAFLDCQDPTEYEFANKELGGWDHWLAMLGNQQILAHVTKWREEWLIKHKSNLLKGMAMKATKGDVPALKFLINREWESKRGRPSKEEREGNIKRDKSVSKEIADDISRLQRLWGDK